MREIVAAAALLCGTISIFAQPASADNLVRFKNDTLDQSNWFKARRQLQIINNDPIVSDHRQQDNDQTYAFRIPPLAPAQASAPIVISPDGSSSSLQGGAPGTVIINPNRLPASHFSTNIPAGGPMRSSLPDGSTSNRLANKDWVRGSMAHPAVAHQSQPQPSAARPTNLAQTPATYGPDTVSGGSGFSSGTTTGKVKGTLLQPRIAGPQHL